MLLCCNFVCNLQVQHIFRPCISQWAKLPLDLFYIFTFPNICSPTISLWNAHPGLPLSRTVLITCFQMLEVEDGSSMSSKFSNNQNILVKQFSLSQSKILFNISKTYLQDSTLQVWWWNHIYQLLAKNYSNSMNWTFRTFQYHWLWKTVAGDAEMAMQRML